MSVGILIELEVRAAEEERFLVATRLYGSQTRREQSRPRVEIGKRVDSSCAYIIHESFRSPGALRAHERAEHTKRWQEAIAELLSRPIQVHQFAPLAGYDAPPPLPLTPQPRPPRPPALETTTRLPSQQEEAAHWLAPPHEPNSALPSSTKLHLPRLQLGVERIEIACARKGFLSSAPEPCLVIGCYRLEDERAEPLGRAIYRFTLGKSAPCELIRNERLLDLPVLIERMPLRIGLLVVAFDEEDGTDIRAAYQDLADPEALLLWGASEREPNPAPFGQHASQRRAGQSERVHLLRDGETLHEAVRDDTWVGAASGVVELESQLAERLLRCHTRSPDDANDWLVELSLRFA